MLTDVIRDNLAQYRDQAYQQHLDRPRRSCLSADCCPECGRPLGLVRQMDGTDHDYHAGGRCED